MRSILACEASSAARAFGRGSFARVMLYEIEHGVKHKWIRNQETKCDHYYNNGARTSEDQ